MEVTRRDAIAGMTVAAAGAGIGLFGAVPAAARTRLDLTSPGGRQHIYIMVKGSLDDRLIIRWVNARYYAVIDDAITPMFNTHAATFSRHRRITDGRYAGGYEMVSGELAWYTDVETGKPADRWYNPFIDRKVNIPTGGLAPSRAAIASDLSVHLEHDAGGMDVLFEVLPFDVHSNDLWTTELIRTGAPVRNAKKPFRYSQNSAYRTTLADLSRPGAQYVTSDISFSNVSGWRPFLEMGDHPGHMMSMGYGQQGAKFDNISKEWKAATQERRPDIFKDPASLLAPIWQTKASWS